MTIRETGFIGVARRWLSARIILRTMLFWAITLSLVGWPGLRGLRSDIPGSANVTIALALSRTGPRSIEMQVDMQKIEELQHSFEEGHQPWRGDAIAVAHVEVTATLDSNVRYEDLKLERETELEATVTGKGTRCWFRVYLKRLVRGQNGIWTAIRIEYDSLGR